MATAFVVLGLLLPRIKDQEASFPLTTNQTTTTQTNPKESSMALRLTPWICLVGLVFFNAGVTSHWTFSERLGASIGLSTYFISTTFTLCNLMTIVGYLFANRLTDRWGVYKPNFTVLFVLGSAILVSAGLLTKWAYVVAIFLFFQTWGMSTIFQLATLSTLDSTGRFIALSPAANGLGMTLGPCIGKFADDLRNDAKRPDCRKFGDNIHYVICFCRSRIDHQRREQKKPHPTDDCVGKVIMV